MYISFFSNFNFLIAFLVLLFLKSAFVLWKKRNQQFFTKNKFSSLFSLERIIVSVS